MESIAPRRVLVLYWTPTPPSEIRAAIRHHLEAIKHGPSHHRVTFWNAFEGSPLPLRKGPYDAVVLHTTLLCLRWFPNFEQWRRKLSWLADLDCLKIAMPQDEYDHSEVLDEWLRSLGVQHVFSNFGEDVRGTLYPYLSRHVDFHHAFTGYIDESTARRVEGTLRPMEQRPFDAVYRASHLPYWFGSLGQLKHSVGERGEAEAVNRHLNVNISTRTEDAIMGEEWFDFLASGRVVLGCESGSSVLDRRGEIQSAIRRYLAESPSASFGEVSSQMPAGWDSYRFAAISPRHFEAVITRTCQVLVQGRYDDVLTAARHYVPVRPDLSDLGDALERASDPAIASEIASCAYEEVYRTGRYTYRVLAEEIDRVLDTRPPIRPLAWAVASTLVARWGAWRLSRPSDLDSSWTVDTTTAEGDAPHSAEPPVLQLRHIAKKSTGRALVASAMRRPLSRRLLREYVLAGTAGDQIPASRLLAEAQLLNRMRQAQQIEPKTPRSGVVTARRNGDVLELHVLRSATGRQTTNGDLGGWPPDEIAVVTDTFGRRPSGSRADGVRLAAVSALAKARPKGVRSALEPLLDSLGGARSRPRVAGGRNTAKTWIATVRALAKRPREVWLLAHGVRRGRLRDAADDLLKLELMTDAHRASRLEVEVDSERGLLRLVSRATGARNPDVRAGLSDCERIVWDNSAAGRYVFAPVAFGRRLTVFLGAGGVHEFTTLEALPAATRMKILRRLLTTAESN